MAFFIILQVIVVLIAMGAYGSLHARSEEALDDYLRALDCIEELEETFVRQCKETRRHNENQVAGLLRDIKVRLDRAEERSIEAKIAAEGLQKSTIIQKVIEKSHFFEKDETDDEKLKKINEAMHDEFFGAEEFYDRVKSRIHTKVDPEDTV